MSTRSPAICIVLAGALIPLLSSAPRVSGWQAGADLPPAKTVRVNGIDLSYVELGRGEPVVLIHGFLHDYRLWSLQLAEFARHFRVIAYSMRHRWPAPPPRDGVEISRAANRSDLVALIKELGLGRAHLVGHSGGANLALRLALDFPALVRSLVLGEPGGFAFAEGGAPAFPPDVIANVRQALDRDDIDRALEFVVGAVAGPDATTRPVLPWVRQMLKDNAWQLRLLGTGRGGGEDPLTCDDVRKVESPVLLVGGDRSPARNRSTLDGLQKCLPAASRAVLDDASHGLELDNPAAFNRIVLDFLTRQASAPGPRTP